MRNLTSDPMTSPAPRPGVFAFRARDVTGMHEISVSDVVRGTPAGSVAQAVAARLDLPTDVPWALRSDRTGAWLQDDQPIDEQVEEDPSTTMTLIPKAHLGGGRG